MPEADSASTGQIYRGLPSGIGGAIHRELLIHQSRERSQGEGVTL